MRRLVWLLFLTGCSGPPRAGSPPERLQQAELRYLEVRELRDLIDVARERGAERAHDGTPVAELLPRYERARSSLVGLLGALEPAGLPEGDRRALEAMRLSAARDLTRYEAAEEEPVPDCRPGAAADASGAGSLERLSEWIYSCFGRAAGHLPVDGEVLDRLTILGLLSRTDDAGRRKRLFLALRPVWESVNGDGSPESPYRRLLLESSRAFREKGSPISESAARLGVAPDALESWLVAILEAWRKLAPATPVEPWDLFHVTGAASRMLSPRIPLESLAALNERFHASVGASPAALAVAYDLAPREGKTPVAFTTFGSRGRGAGRPRPWVFATYRDGGLENLVELLHETGHAIHIAAIDTRPAFRDWPDSDPFTEALGDLLALEAYEPDWQERYLGAAAPLPDSIRARYAGIALDVAWALLEMRLHAAPRSDPNAVWTELAGRYLGVAPHPELSWWALRGQLVGSPGYMANYALGAVIVADLRARVRELRGGFAGEDLYPWLSERLYRFGRERPAREVIEAFLGRPLSPDALLRDMSRGAR